MIAALGDLSRSRALAEGRRLDFVREATARAAKVLGVERVSVWEYEPDRKAIRCFHLHHRSGPAESGAVLRAQDFPAYFLALSSDPMIGADDACRDPRTHEFAASYLEPLGIGAMLDAPILRGPELSGVVCHEHVGGQRVWTAEEKIFAAALGDLVALAFEIAARHEEAARVRARDHALHVALDATRMGIWRWEPSSGRLDWAGATASLLGLPSDHAPSGVDAYLSRVHPDDLAGMQRVITAFATEAPPEATIQHRHRVMVDGNERWLETWVRSGPGDPPVIAGTLVDITAQLELERRLVESQQLEMLGQLAGGIAHNFNNLLAIVTGYADLLGPLVADRPDAAGFVHAISEAAERSATITQQLLALTRSRTSTPVATDAGALATRVSRLMNPLIGARLTLRSEVPRVPAIVQIDPGQLEQVLMNLVLNARDAIATVGQIHIDVRAVTLASPVPARPQPVPAGRWVVLEVRDDGTGMGPDVQARAFEPFFSTREPGRGTGLGLSTCLAIVARAGGALQVASSPGTGTTVSVWLPSHTPGPVLAANAAPQPGGRRALVIDDQKAVADLLLRVLLRAGWDAEAASDVEAALAVAARLERLDLVVSDVMIPGLRGPGILERIREFHPDVAAVFVSGYTADALTTAGTLPAGTRFVEKPFRPIDLVQAAELAIADRVRSSE